MTPLLLLVKWKSKKKALITALLVFYTFSMTVLVFLIKSAKNEDYQVSVDWLVNCVLVTLMTILLIIYGFVYASNESNNNEALKNYEEGIQIKWQQFDVSLAPPTTVEITSQLTKLEDRCKQPTISMFPYTAGLGGNGKSNQYKYRG